LIYPAAQWGATALLKAANYGQQATIRALVKLRADINASKVCACRARAGGDALTLGLRRQRGGVTALHAAARNGHELTSEELVMLGADIDLVKKVRTPRAWCSRERAYRLARLTCRTTTRPSSPRPASACGARWRRLSASAPTSTTRAR
jgi:ankyrin repeat protein